jgi:hypothetical protein
MIESTWNKTYRRQALPGLTVVSVVTAVHGDYPINPTLVADLQIRQAGGGVDTRVDIPMTPAQMRALAGLLTEAASRVEDDLLPLLEREPDIIPFTLDPVAQAA